MGMPSVLEENLALQLRAEKINFEREVTGLVPGRKFRVDFLIADKLVCEVQGGTWIKGGHSTGKGIARDLEKHNLLLLAGYICMPVTAQQVKSGKALEWIKHFLSLDRPSVMASNPFERFNWVMV